MACISCTDFNNLIVTYNSVTTDIVVSSNNLTNILPTDTVTLKHTIITCSSATPTTRTITSADVVTVGNNSTYTYQDTLNEGLHKFELSKDNTTCVITETYILFIDSTMKCSTIDYAIDNKGTKLIPETRNRLKPLLLHYALSNAQGCVCDEDKMKLLYDELRLILGLSDENCCDGC